MIEDTIYSHTYSEIQESHFIKGRSKSYGEKVILSRCLVIELLQQLTLFSAVQTMQDPSIFPTQKPLERSIAISRSLDRTQGSCLSHFQSSLA